MVSSASSKSSANVIVAPREIPKILEERNTLMGHLTLAITNVEKLDSQAAMHVGDEAWEQELNRHLRHVQHTQIALQHTDYMLELAQRARTEAAETELARTQTLLSKSITWATWVMALAV